MNHSSFNKALVPGIIGCLTLAGCVSTSKYKKMESDKDQQISQLQNQVATMQKAQGDLQQQNADLAAQKTDLANTNAVQQAQYNQIVGQLAKEVQNGQLKVTQYKNMLTVDVAEKIFFSSGSALLKDSGKDILKKLAKPLAAMDKYVRVVGHTDNVRVSESTQAKFPSNWELSAIRATNVVRYLQEAGVPPEHLIISARGQYDPISPNNTDDGRQQNRRIEIMLLEKNLVEAVKSK